MNNETMKLEKNIQTLILRGIEGRIKEIIEEEVNTAVIKVEQRIRGEVDKIALQMLDWFTIEDYGHTIKIEVKKEIQGKEKIK